MQVRYTSVNLNHTIIDTYIYAHTTLNRTYVFGTIFSDLHAIFCHSSKRCPPSDVSFVSCVFCEFLDVGGFTVRTAVQVHQVDVVGVEDTRATHTTAERHPARPAQHRLHLSVADTFHLKMVGNLKLVETKQIFRICIHVYA